MGPGQNHYRGRLLSVRAQHDSGQGDSAAGHREGQTGAHCVGRLPGIVKLPPKRGTIYDREGHELAVSVEVESVYVHPHHVQNKAQAAKLLSKILDMKESALLSLLKSQRPFVWIDRKVAPEKIRQVKALGIEGVGFTAETRRYYPGKEIAGHVLGFAGEDNQGLEGLEKKYDKLLKGPDYTLIQMRDALGRPFYVNRPTPEESEIRDLVLTIDKDIQYAAEQALKKTMEETRAKNGHAIVVEVDSGEILAMAVAPLFNPNVFLDAPAQPMEEPGGHGQLRTGIHDQSVPACRSARQFPGFPGDEVLLRERGIQGRHQHHP